MKQWIADNMGPLLVFTGAAIFLAAALSPDIPTRPTAWQADCKPSTIRQASSTNGKTQTMTVTCEVKQ